MIERYLARMRSHRINISRYRNLLNTRLSELERQFIERRLAEEMSKLEELTASRFPLTGQLPASPSMSQTSAA